MERGPLEPGEGQRASDNRQVLDWGPCRVSASSPPETGAGTKVGGHQGGRAPRGARPSQPPAAVGDLPLLATATPAAATWRAPGQGRLCTQPGRCPPDQVGGRSAGHLSTKIMTETLLEALLGAGPSVEEPVSPQPAGWATVWSPCSPVCTGGSFPSKGSQAPRSSGRFPVRQCQSQA